MAETHPTELLAKALGLISMLKAITVEDGCTIFEHTAEEIGLEVMENHSAILAALQSKPTEGASE